LKNPVLYRGSGLTLTKFENNQVFGILRAEDTTYSYLHGKDLNLNTGNNIILVAAV